MTDAVYEPAYEPYEGSRTSRAGRVGTIAARSLRVTLSSTWFWVIFGLSLVHLAARGVFLQMSAEGAIPGQTAFSAAFLADTLASQARWAVTFVLAAVGAGVVAEDLQAGGLTFYFTKPITKPGYLAGKLAGPFAASLAVTALPLATLWLIGVAFTPETAYPDRVWLLPLTLLLASLVASAVATLVVAALSALVANRGWTAGVWIALVLVLATAARVAEAVTGNPDAALLDPYNALDDVSRWILGAETSDASTWGAGLAVAGWALAALAGLAWGLERQEVAG